MKITLFLTSIWLAFASWLLPAEKVALGGKISGTGGQILQTASVKILKNRVLVISTLSDANGQYRCELDPGAYDVEFAHPGFVTTRIVGVEVSAKETNNLDVRLEGGATLEEVVVQHFKTSVYAYGSPGETAAVTSDDIRTVSLEEVAVTKADIEPAPKGETAKRIERELSSGFVSEGETSRAKAKMEPAKDAPPPAPPADAGYEELVIDGAKKKVRILFDPETYEEKVEVISDESVVPPPGSPVTPAPRAGLLTAGEWNDLHNWNRHWADLLSDGEIDVYQNMYGFFPKQRYTVLLTNAQDFPLADAPVQLKIAGETIWEARTDNTGKAELWAGLFNADSGQKTPSLTLEATVNGEKHELGQPKPAKDGINRFKMDIECAAPKNVDIVWAVDATGSMGDEIEYLKTELLDVIGRAKGRNPDLSFRMGTVFYRDESDAYITKSSGLSYDISKTVDFIRKQWADGGGDYPEAVHSALDEAIFGQKWSEHAIARICFLVLDASPHQSPEINASLQKSIREAARLGIRIVPVTASGIQKDTEFLMKFFGLATNGTYVFLTDHSGIGGKHLEPTSDEYKVEPLNELLVRLITEYTSIETCEGKSNIRFDPGQQQGQAWQAQYYPNPASSQFILELPVDVQSVTIYDSEGKAVRKLEKPQAGQNTVLISDLSEGFYTIRILKDGQMQSGKLMVVRA